MAPEFQYFSQQQNSPTEFTNIQSPSNFSIFNTVASLSPNGMSAANQQALARRMNGYHRHPMVRTFCQWQRFQICQCYIITPKMNQCNENNTFTFMNFQIFQIFKSECIFMFPNVFSKSLRRIIFVIQQKKCQFAIEWTQTYFLMLITIKQGPKVTEIMSENLNIFNKTFTFVPIL